MMKKIFGVSLMLWVALALMQGADEKAAMPAAGSMAPEFSLTSGEGGAVSLKDYRGKWVVLYFYPKDFTGGCTLEAKNFERDAVKYKALDAVVLGVSADTAASHKDFCAKEGLNFKLLADPKTEVIAQYGSVMDYKGQKMAARNTFVIDPEGKIAKTYAAVKPATHSEQVLEDLKALEKK